MDFLKDFEKTVSKIDGVGGVSEPPRYWFSTGNHVLNKVISGSFNKGIPQGRITVFTGPSASGKSFLTGNVVAQAQKEGAYILAVDSENALDDDFMEAIGVDTKNNYTYKSVITIGQCQKVISSFLKGFKKEYGDSHDAPQILICIDSLSMLMTDTELDNYDKGVLKGDQGQRNKQLKAMLRTFVQDIKALNVTMTATAQVYKNQDMLNGEGVWIVPDAVKYSASQIVMTTKLKLRDKETRDVDGIKMKCEGYKTRFTKPFQTVTIEVPYEIGIDPYNGLLPVAKELSIVKQAGSWYTFGDNKFQSKNFGQYAEEILIEAESKRAQFLEAILEENEAEDLTEGKKAGTKRVERVLGSNSLD